MIRPSAIDYNGRQVDIEWLQSILAPTLSAQRLHMQFDPNTKIVAGMQKMAQRFTNTFLTAVGEVKFDQEFGTTFWSDLFRGVAQNLGQVAVAVVQAIMFAVDNLQGDDLQTDVYGELPDDERIADATLLDYSIDRNTGTLQIRIELVSAAGSSYVYTIPVQAIRS